MNVTRPNYFQGRGRGRGRSRCEQRNDINFFQVVREGSRRNQASGPVKNSSNSKSTTTSSDLQRTRNRSPQNKGTAGSMFSRPITCSGSGLETCTTTHLGFEEPSAFEILCSNQSLSTNSMPFQCQSRNELFFGGSELMNQNLPGFQNIFYSPTNPSRTESNNFYQGSDPCLENNTNFLTVFGAQTSYSSNDDYQCFSNIRLFKELNENRNYANLLIDNRNQISIDDSQHDFIHSGNNEGNQMRIFNENTETNFLNNFNRVENLFFNSMNSSDNNSDEEQTNRGKKRVRIDPGEQNKSDFHLKNNYPGNYSNNSAEDILRFSPMRQIRETTPSDREQAENREPIFRQPLPPKQIKIRRKITPKTSNHESYCSPEEGLQTSIAGSIPQTPSRKARSGDKVDGFRTPLSTPRRLAGLFVTPPSAFSSLPRATDYFLTPTLETTPVLTRDETSTPTTYSTKTPANRKVITSEPDNYYIIALTEGRGTAVGEVGLACIDIKCPSIQLCQFSDSQTYMKTLTKINIYNPAELIIPDTFLTPQNTSDLFKAVTEKFENMKVVTVKRVYFNDQSGFDMIKDIILPELSSIEITIQKKYYALSAVSALIKYVEFEHNLFLHKNSIKVEFQCANGVVFIDLETARRLELVTGNTSGAIADRCCLLAVVNKCRTLGGKRRLRTLILQPPSKLSVIMDVQEAVDFLVHDPIFLCALQNMLSKLSDVEKLLWLCKRPPNFKREQKTCENLTTFVLLLKKTVEEIPALRELLGDAQQDFFIKLRLSLSDSSLDVIKEIILKTINEDAKPSKSYSASEIQRCFSIKEKVNELLDVVRITYSNLITLVQEEVDKLAETHGLPLKITQSGDRGFHVMYSVPRNQIFVEDSLPPTFIQVRVKGNSIKFTTKEIYCLNTRISRTLQEIQLISNVILFEMVIELRKHIGVLYRLCENIAETDVICGLAQASMTQGYVKPTFGTNLNLSSARHPILDVLHPSKPIPNSVFASKAHNVCVITGPNMSGKTIYVTMIPLIQIMAQLGCFVPAEKAEIRITNHIAVRKGDLDNMGNGISSFAHEIKEFIYIQQSMTKKSLIIADEIFQGTSSEEGIAMAWAYAEELLTMPAFTFISTHYLYLTNLPSIFSNVTNYHLEVIERCTENVEDFAKLTFTYRVLPGASTINYYGLRLLRNAHLPEALKEEIFFVANQLKQNIASALPVANLIDSDKLVQFKKINKLEAFMKNMFELIQTDNLTMDMVEGLQRMTTEEILSSDEDCSDSEESQIRSAQGSVEKSDQQSKTRSSASIEISDVVSMKENFIIRTPNRDKECESSQQLKEKSPSNSRGTNLNMVRSNESMCEKPNYNIARENQISTDPNNNNIYDEPFDGHKSEVSNNNQLKMTEPRVMYSFLNDNTSIVSVINQMSSANNAREVLDCNETENRYERQICDKELSGNFHRDDSYSRAYQELLNENNSANRRTLDIENDTYVNEYSEQQTYEFQSNENAKKYYQNEILRLVEASNKNPVDIDDLTSSNRTNFATNPSSIPNLFGDQDFNNRQRHLVQNEMSDEFIRPSTGYDTYSSGPSYQRNSDHLSLNQHYFSPRNNLSQDHFESSPRSRNIPVSIPKELLENEKQILVESKGQFFYIGTNSNDNQTPVLRLGNSRQLESSYLQDIPSRICSPNARSISYLSDYGIRSSPRSMPLNIESANLQELSFREQSTGQRIESVRSPHSDYTGQQLF